MLADREPGSVLVVSGTEKGREYLTQLLPKGDFETVAAVSAAGEAKRLLLQKQFDLVLINTPLSDEYGLELAVNICEDTGCGVMVLVKAETYEMAADKIEDFGALTVVKPNSKQNILQSLKLVAATRARIRRVEKENEKLKNKMEEVRIVSRAKWLLIENEGLNESDAHRKIEKLSMDQRRTRRQVADDIINMYQN